MDGEIGALAGKLRRTQNHASPAKCPSCRRTLGKLKLPDALIAATAISEGAILVTRNVKDFASLAKSGLLKVITPSQIDKAKKQIRKCLINKEAVGKAYCLPTAGSLLIADSD